MPSLPFMRTKRRAPPFYSLDEELPLVLAIASGFQHSLAMLAGLITPPIIFANSLNLDSEMSAYMISASLIASGALNPSPPSRTIPDDPRQASSAWCRCPVRNGGERPLSAYELRIIHFSSSTSSVTCETSLYSGSSDEDHMENICNTRSCEQKVDKGVQRPPTYIWCRGWDD